MQIQPGWTPAQRNEASKAYGDFQKRIMTLPGRFNPDQNWQQQLAEYRGQQAGPLSLATPPTAALSLEP
jgi:hypothetical protein